MKSPDAHDHDFKRVHDSAQHRDDTHEFSYDTNTEVFSVRFLFVIAPVFLIISLLWLMVDWKGYLSAKFRHTFHRKVRRSVLKSPKLRKTVKHYKF
ncbi:Oidioi.mRNA.OKI2018_I69.chr1.g284.t1.cds [Oikopleura dioica]|uniref:Oidioi.mRNA.OKI2018_I69.chr1.g284.t1.cds n=1 Tax=Oikopleura dioica TaxID=34765 RepID=A0ABN7SRJ8_OIKDI|nr:Oidioi.mRNA.OKI2018_I69.chr1.g284.t1.cds [Oikopleura dioica]